MLGIGPVIYIVFYPVIVDGTAIIQLKLTGIVLFLQQLDAQVIMTVNHRRIGESFCIKLVVPTRGQRAIPPPKIGFKLRLIGLVV